MNILPLRSTHIEDAARLFALSFRRLRQSIPVLPDRMENPLTAGGLLEELLAHSGGFAAIDEGKLVGYLGWWMVDGFRGTQRRAGYVPEWAHAAVEDNKTVIYRALYRQAASHWHEQGCDSHAITLLARDDESAAAWFWNGFGLAVVDAVRPVSPIGALLPVDYTLRRALLSDAEALAVLEAEHVQHYAAPPTLMVPFEPFDPEGYEHFLDQQGCFAYLALRDGEPAGYMRFESSGHGAAEVVQAENGVANTGVYVRHAHRGKRLAPALLELALGEFNALGMRRCSVDFESFNPEAASFWPRYFEPACLSVMRVPEICCIKRKPPEGG